MLNDHFYFNFKPLILSPNKCCVTLFFALFLCSLSLSPLPSLRGRIIMIKKNVDPTDVEPGVNFYMRADYTISCSSDRYRFGVIWSSCMILVYPIGVPLLYYWLLTGMKATITTRFQPLPSALETAKRETMLFPLKLLFDNYHPHFWYWEVIEVSLSIFIRIFISYVISTISTIYILTYEMYMYVLRKDGWMDSRDALCTPIM